MTEEPIDLRFFGEQMKRLQSDVRVLKTDGAQMRAEMSRLEGEIAGVKADIIRVEMRMDAFAESVSDRFDQSNELAKSNFRILDQKIERIAAALDQKIGHVTAEVNRMAAELNQKIDIAAS